MEVPGALPPCQVLADEHWWQTDHCSSPLVEACLHLHGTAKEHYCCEQCRPCATGQMKSKQCALGRTGSPPAPTAGTDKQFLIPNASMPTDYRTKTLGRTCSKTFNLALFSEATFTRARETGKRSMPDRRRRSSATVLESLLYGLQVSCKGSSASQTTRSAERGRRTGLLSIFHSSTASLTTFAASGAVSAMVATDSGPILAWEVERIGDKLYR